MTFPKNHKRLARLALAALISAQAVLPAISQASTTTSTVNIGASVASQCTIGGSSLSFGSYDPAAGSPNDATATIAVQCNNGKAYNVGLDAGGFSGATVSDRKMNGPDALGLSYALYSDSGRGQNWGDTVGTDTVSGTGDGASHDLTVYGRIPTGQFITDGAYTDVVTATLTF